MNRTSIPYLDYTWNPMHGCEAIAAGCVNCWARGMAKRQAAMGNRGYDPADPFKVVCDESKLDEPLNVKKPARIGVSFMGDLFHEDVPFEFIDRVFSVLAVAYQHTYLLLTKRPSRAVSYLADMSGQFGNHRSWWACVNLLDALEGEGKPFPAVKQWQRGWPLPNVHLGTSCSTQADLDKNLPELLGCPAAVRWLSLEPMLEKLRLGFTRAPTDDDYRGWHADGPINSVITTRAQAIGGVVVGCESGPGHRLCKIEWIESVVEQCDAAGVPVYVKQVAIGGCASTVMAEWPENLRRQELPA